MEELRAFQILFTGSRSKGRTCAANGFLPKPQQEISTTRKTELKLEIVAPVVPPTTGPTSVSGG